MSSFSNSYIDRIKADEQANMFGMCFLMPESEYLKVVRMYTVNGVTNISGVAAYFGVDVYLAQSRGVQLGVLEPSL